MKERDSRWHTTHTKTDTLPKKKEFKFAVYFYLTLQ